MLISVPRLYIITLTQGVYLLYIIFTYLLKQNSCEEIGFSNHECVYNLSNFQLVKHTQWLKGR